MTSIPTVTRTLEVRAIAHLPVSRPVDVFDLAAPVRVTMLTMQPVLDTVRITAGRMGSNRLIDVLARTRDTRGPSARERRTIEPGDVAHHAARRRE